MYSICYCSCVLLVFLQLFTGACYSQHAVPEISFRAEYANSTRFLKRVLDDFQCKLPSYPENGQWSVINGFGRPGDDVDINTMIKFECLPGYMLTPDTPYVVCESNWSPEIIPKCRRLCRPFYSTPTTNLKCKDRNGYAIGCDKATDGTYLTYECIPHYEVPLGRKQSLLCYDGIWDFPKPVCQPVCGKKPANDTLTLSWGASDAKDSEYPWVVAIYEKNGVNYTNVCGGTLISRRVVITAAHCVTNDYGQTLPNENYEVAAGKYYNKHGDCRDKEAQYMKIAHILAHKQFRAEHRRYQYDIAVIVTKKLFILGPKVQPICINDINYIYPHIGDIGEVSIETLAVAGWGKTENGEPSDNLKALKIPMKKASTCASELPPDWERRYNLEDKICTGFFRQNMSVCKGDSGSGLIFKNPEDNRFYLHGVVSLSPKSSDGQCNHEQNALFTKVAIYYEWIDRESTTNYVEECSLPAHPRNGKWVMENGAVKKPGEIVPSTAVLIFSCNDGYKLSAVSPKFFCEPSLQPPTCNLLCPSLIFPKNSTVICKNYKNENIDCTETTEGSSISFTCPSGYATSQGTSGVRFCVNGSWGKPKPVCKRKYSITPQTNTTATTTPLLNQTVEDTTGVKVICTYNSDYSHKGVYPENLDASMCTHLVYAYIGLWDKGDVRVQDDLIDLDQEHRGLYLRSTDLKRKNPNLKVLLSVGGTSASNSTLFSRIAGHARKTGAFLGSSGYFIKTYHFDGLNIDWHYPKEEDKEKYMSFLETVRYEFDKSGWLLSASVHPDPVGTGYDPPKMNKLLDWITIKSYDFYEASSSNYTGIHNPLYHSPKETKWEKSHLNMEAAANNWINAGISREKLVLSVAFHGRSFQLKDADKHEIHSPITGRGPGDDTGFLDYSEICSAYENYTGVWDDDQKTPYKYHENKWFGFNNKDSVWIKGDYVRKKGFFGVNVWPVDADDVHGKCGTKQVLLKHVHGGIGNKVNWDND